MCFQLIQLPTTRRQEGDESVMHVTMQQLLFYNFSLFQQTKPLNPKTVSLNPFLVPADCITQSGEYQFSQRSHKLVDAFEVELVKIQHWKF
jgi:hypothetical protein